MNFSNGRSIPIPERCFQPFLSWWREESRDKSRDKRKNGSYLTMTCPTLLLCRQDAPFIPAVPSVSTSATRLNPCSGMGERIILWPVTLKLTEGEAIQYL